MIPANGYNPLRWDCLTRGCFNLKRRPKIEVFADCFPGRINFGDVDGIVEINGNALLLEWKSEAHELPTGQRILYARLTHSGFCSAMIVVGDAETMIAVATSIFDRGIKYPARGYERADLQLIKHRLAAWAPGDWDIAARKPMTDFTPSPRQTHAIRDIKDWFENRAHEQPVFRVWGYAGTGKSTLTKHAIAELGLDTMTRAADGTCLASGGVLYAALTGKAALVMTRKGTPASTIHSLIYRVSEATREEIERVKEDIAAIRAKLPKLGPRERFLEESRLRSLELRLDDIHKPRFVLNEQSIVRDARLIVLDEVSMVGAEMAADLLAFGKPILVLGDPGQLPPIKGDGAFTRDAPDVMLTEIHRQAGESAIIRLATMARQGQPIAYGEHDAYVWKMRRDEVGPEQMLHGGQVICGRNATRIQLNTAMKEAAGFPEVYPIGEARNGHVEKIICLKNRNDLGVVNGMFLELSDVRDETAHCFSAVVRSEDGETLGAGGERQFIYKGHFEDHVAPDRERERRDHWIRKGLIEAVWGYAITCHKAQGSAWPNVLVFDDGLGRTAEDRARWLYTAITRAEKGLVLLD